MIDTPPAEYADPQLGIEDESWRLAKTGQNLEVFVGATSATYCLLVIKSEVGTQACSQLSVSTPLSMVSETPDGTGDVAYIVVSDAYVFASVGGVDCVAANNIIAIENPLQGDGVIELLDQDGASLELKLPSSIDGKVSVGDPQCL
ncbi:hypothetical protein [Brachybacterium hainanense]|uniref:Uncharacterized protein n=1 Tax=Brachybacterium hainanense TaxID=1541174 RepID=A0ABV6RFB3_9MICO